LCGFPFGDAISRHYFLETFSVSRKRRKVQMKRELKIFDKPKNVKIFLAFFYVSLIALLIVDFFIHKHADFPWEGAPNFYAVYGFVSCVLLIFIAKILRLFIKRNENYYE
jgi:hypothetical protein